MEKIKEFLTNRSKLIIVAIIILALALPFIVNQVLKQQDLRQRANTANPVTITLSPSTKDLTLNEEFEVSIMVDTNGNDISAVDGSLLYDPAQLTLDSLTAGANYKLNQETATLDPYAQPFTLYNDSVQPSIGSSIILAVAKFKAITKGTATVKFGSTSTRSLKIAASGSSSNVPLSQSGEPKGIYTIGDGSSVGGDCDAGGGKLKDGCSCNVNSDCSSNKCVDVVSTVETNKVCEAASPTPTCTPRPACLDEVPKCALPEPEGGWCSTSSAQACVNNIAGGGSIIACPDDKASLFFYYCVDGTNGILGDSSTCQSTSQFIEQAKLKCNPNNTTDTSACLESVALVVNVYSDANKDGGGYDYLQGDRVIPNVPVTVTTPLGAKSGKTDQYGKFYYSMLDKDTTVGKELGEMTASITIPSGYSGTSTQGYTVLNGTHGGVDFPLKKGEDPIPTATLAPTATPIPGDTTLNLKVQLPGIGSGPVNLGLNNTPIHPQRKATIKLFDNTNTAIKTVEGIATYNNSTSNYEGVFSLGPEFATGSYSIKMKLDNALYKSIPGIVQITKGTTNQNSTVATLITGDLNADNTLGVFDWTYIIACIKKESSCTNEMKLLSDLNDNGVIDEPDVQILQRGFAIRDGD